MNNGVKKYLFDMLDAIAFIEIETREIKHFSNYEKNEVLKAAVERKIEIIGEALHKAVKLQPDLEITNKEKIISIRNRLIHAYDAVDDLLIWEIITRHTRLLKAELEKLLNS